MDSIEKVHRRGVDVETAFTAGVRQARADPQAPGYAPGGRVTTMRTGGIGGRAKALIRPPFVRLRRFFLAPLQKELGQQVGEIRAEIEAIKRSRTPVAIPTADGNVLVRTEVGYVLSSTADLRMLVGLIESGGLEPGNRLLIERLTGPGSVFVDADAGLGLHALAAARVMRGDGHVLAFAPSEAAAALIRESVRINGLEDFLEVRPPFGSLDDALADAPPVSLLRIGGEGALQDVLSGARKVIERSPEIAIMVELRPPALAREGRSLTTWFAGVQGFGFEFRVIDQDTGRLWNRTIASIDVLESVHLLFARPEARAWLRAGSA